MSFPTRNQIISIAFFSWKIKHIAFHVWNTTKRCFTCFNISFSLQYFSTSISETSVQSDYGTWVVKPDFSQFIANKNNVKITYNYVDVREWCNPLAVFQIIELFFSNLRNESTKQLIKVTSAQLEFENETNLLEPAQDSRDCWPWDRSSEVVSHGRYGRYVLQRLTGVLLYCIVHKFVHSLFCAFVVQK